jgi:hypothetical protein
VILVDTFHEHRGNPNVLTQLAIENGELLFGVV